jgi:hypothetical protein
MRAVFALALLLLAGCTSPSSFHAARVPDALLQGDGGNGWEPDGAHSDAAPRQANGGLQAQQTLAYKDDGQGGNGGFPASMALTTLKLLPTPTESQLRDIVRTQVQERSAEQGIQLGDQQLEGARTLADGHGTLYFMFTGTVTGNGPLFTTRDATAKILGEVWNCPEAGTSVAAVGLAQVSTIQVIGGVPVTQQTDARNWQELAGDPSASVDGQRDGNGLVYNVVCRA